MNLPVEAECGRERRLPELGRERGIRRPRKDRGVFMAAPDTPLWAR